MNAGCPKYRIAELQPADSRRWDEFVLTCDRGTFFHLSGWKSIIENVLHHPARFLFCEKDGEIVAVLPVAQVKSWLFGDALISLPFLVYGGVASTDPKAESLLVEAVIDHAKALRTDYIELRNREGSGRGWFSSDTYATFSKRLDPDPEQNLLAIPRKQRAMVRKGMKFGLQAETDDGIERLYTSLLACKRNLGTPFFDSRYLRAVKDEFGDKAEVITVTNNNETVCSVMSFRFRNEILPYYGGGGDSARGLNGNDFMYWAVMEKACKEGVEIFDYGRSMVGSGAYRFKKHWGFEPTILGYEYLPIKKQNAPELNPSNPKFKFLIDAWKRLPLAVAARLGPPIARRLG